VINKKEGRPESHSASSNSQVRLSVTEKVYTALKHDIMWGKIESGTLLSELKLAARFGVSRTPVREALTMLASDGLINTLPRHHANGTFGDSAPCWVLAMRFQAECLDFRFENLDPSLAFYGCCDRNECGRCTVTVNGRPVLACTTRVKNDLCVAPLRGKSLVPDLVVDLEER